MKKKYMLILLVFLLTVGFASVSTTLLMNGTIGVAHKKSDFNVIFKNTRVTGNAAAVANISENKRTITFETDKLSTVGDSAELVYKVKNDSTQYDANVSVTCTGGNPGYTSIVSEFAGKSLPLTTPELMRAQEVRMGKVSVNLTKAYDASVTKTPITCTLVIQGEERDTIANSSVCDYSDGTEWIFDYTGNVQEFTIPCDGEYKVELWGAQGGGKGQYTGGLGAYTKGNIVLDSFDKLYLVVGGAGSLPTSSSNVTGGFNGGGGTYGSPTGNVYYNIAGTGGGATDVRVLKPTLEYDNVHKTNITNIESLFSRIMIAAGGGGGTHGDIDGWVSTGYGAPAGGLIGYNGQGSYYGNSRITIGGTQTSGGSGQIVTTGHAGSYVHAGFGYGGGQGWAPWGGGGSGYYGGGSGGGWSGAGAGGSSFISGHDGCDAISKTSTKSSIIHTGQPNHYLGYVFTDTKMVDGAGYNWTTVKDTEVKQMPTHDGSSTMIGNAGNGYAKITLISAAHPYKETLLNGADPVIKEGLVPVTIENDGTVRKADIEVEWYKYEDKKWANAVILNDETINYNAGDIIPENNIESYFVWIPRYKYQIFDEGNYTTSSTFDTKKVQTINIEFENKETEPSTGLTKGNYLTHPAFTNFDVNGLWVAKFETGYKGATTTAAAQVNSSNSNYIEIKPNVYSWRSLTLGNMFKASYDYKRNLDSHLMKNTEWGAVAYLQHSKYGSTTSVRVNNNSANITGYAATEEPTTGFTGGSSIAGNRSESTSLNADGIYTKRYNTTTGYLASTTGNITGIYDMSGGTNEYVMGYTTKSETEGSLSEITSIIPDFFTNKEWDKYYDKYTSTVETNWNNRILGDATGEMGTFQLTSDPGGGSRYKSSWYYDYAKFIHSGDPWFIRGGRWYEGIAAGTFSFDNDCGRAHNQISFRVVLAP